MQGDGGLRQALWSIAVTPVTPFAAGGPPDPVGLRANIEFLVDSGIGLLYPCGNTGEFSSLGLDEWMTVVETVIAVSQGRALTMPGVGGPLPVAKEMIRLAEQAGVDGFLLLPPHQPQVADLAVQRYWTELMDQTILPVVLYKRAWPTDQTLRVLAGLDQVAAIKYGQRDPEAFASLARTETGTVWTCGVAERWAPFFSLSGSTGFTSGLANFAPNLSLALSGALGTGDYKTAMQLRDRAFPFEEIRARENDANNVAAVKHAMDTRGLAGGRVRPPLRDLDESTKADVDSAIKLLDI
jgi:4-hydroxy-tetrahydrodipicolinate synthase